MPTGASISEAKKKEIYSRIHWGMSSDERLPGEVIADKPYNGDEEAYLLDMAKHLGIELD